MNMLKTVPDKPSNFTLISECDRLELYPNYRILTKLGAILAKKFRDRYNMDPLKKVLTIGRWEMPVNHYPQEFQHTVGVHLRQNLNSLQRRTRLKSVEQSLTKPEVS